MSRQLQIDMFILVWGEWCVAALNSASGSISRWLWCELSDELYTISMLETMEPSKEMTTQHKAECSPAQLLSLAYSTWVCITIHFNIINSSFKSVNDSCSFDINIYIFITPYQNQPK